MVLWSGASTVRRLILVALVCVPVLLGAQPASGYVIGGRAWPHGVITYYDAFPRDNSVVRAAVEAWNHSGADIHFIGASRGKADVIILPLAHSNGNTEGGNADLGWEPITYTYTFGSKTIVRYRTRVEHVHLRPVDPAHGWNSALMTVAATHELGHILGLGHSHTCATMDAVLVQRCGAPHAWQFACRALQPDDVRGAIALYGGHARPVGRQRDCSFTPAPKPPIGLQGRFSRSGAIGSSDYGFAKLTWKMPSGATYLGNPVIDGYEVFAAPNTCSTAPSARREQIHANPGQAITAYEYLPGPGAWCFAVEIVDAWDRKGPPIKITVAPPPTAAFDEMQGETNGLLYDFTDQSAANAGTVVQYAWNFGDPASGANNTSTQQNPSHVFSAPGAYGVTETVTNSFGQRGTDTEDIAAQDYVAPVAAFDDNCGTDGACSLSFETPYEVDFTDQSGGVDGSIESWAWNFGDPSAGADNTSTQQYPLHNYDAAGTYTVTLTVTDEHGKQASTSQTVYIDG